MPVKTEVVVSHLLYQTFKQGLPVMMTEIKAIIPAPPRPATTLPAMAWSKVFAVPLHMGDRISAWDRSGMIGGSDARYYTAYHEQAVGYNERLFTAVHVAHASIL